MREIEFGLDTFGGVTVDENGEDVSHPQVIRDLVSDAVLADEVGLDFFGVGEHHRPDYAVSSPEMVLAAIASRTDRIRLGSAVTVLSSDDPVRVFERFATLDAVSNGRAEIVAGRGSFIESFPLFGYDLKHYEVLFEEKLALLAELLTEKPVTWSGSTRASLSDQRVYPTTADGIRAWVGVGGSPESVVRTARHNFGLFLAIIGGAPERFRPYIDLFRRAQDELEVDRKPIAPDLLLKLTRKHVRSCIPVGSSYVKRWWVSEVGQSRVRVILSKKLKADPCTSAHLKQSRRRLPRQFMRSTWIASISNMISRCHTQSSIVQYSCMARRLSHS